jgi:hypothetical protein
MRNTNVIALILALIIAVPSAMAQSSSCTSVTPSNNTFSAALIGSGISGSPNGFGSVNFSLSGTQATVTARSLGLGNNITGIMLFQGAPGSTAVPVQTFSSSTDGFINGQFIGTMTLDQNLANQIQANPGNFFFVINTAQFPNGAVAGSLMPAHPQLIAGRISGSGLTGGGSNNGSGAFLFTVGPNNGSGSVPLNFDIATFGLGNGFNSLSLTPAGGGAPLVILGTNATADNGRVVGSTTISNALAQQLLANPCSFTLSLTTPNFPNGAAMGTLAAANELFIPVAGSASGANGTHFQTDLNIFNNSTVGISDQSASANAFVQFFPTAGTSTAQSISAQNVNALDISPRGTTLLRDVSSSVFGGAINGIGALRIVSTGNLFANARIYDNQILAGHGTTGQSEPGMFRSQALQQGMLVGVGVENNANGINLPSYRTNVGFLNPNDTSTTVAVELRDSNGSLMSSRLVTLGAWAQTQMPISGPNGLFPDVTGNFATSSVYFLSGMPVFAYASIIDNVSGDASFVIPSSNP